MASWCCDRSAYGEVSKESENMSRYNLMLTVHLHEYPPELVRERRRKHAVRGCGIAADRRAHVLRAQDRRRLAGLRSRPSRRPEVAVRSEYVVVEPRLRPHPRPPCPRRWL